MNTPDEVPRGLPLDLLKWLGAHRDGFLVAGAILYGLGYLVWAVNAAEQHFGNLPALDFQYVMSGIIPAVILALAWAGIALFSRWRTIVARTMARFKILGWLLGVTFGALSLLKVLVQWRMVGHPRTHKEALTYSVIGIMGFLVIYIFMMDEEFAENAPFARFFKVLVPFVFCCTSLVLYITLYGSLPRVLGGPTPRCAYVDLVRDETAQATLLDLVASPPNSTDKVIRSQKLNVYFETNDYLLVRPAIFVAGMPLYQLRKEMIRAVQWCSDSP